MKPPQKPTPSSASACPSRARPLQSAEHERPDDVDQRACPSGTRASRWCATTKRSGRRRRAPRATSSAVIRCPPRRRTPAARPASTAGAARDTRDQAGGQGAEAGTPRRGRCGRRRGGASLLGVRRQRGEAAEQPGPERERQQLRVGGRRRTPAGRRAANEPTTLIANVVHGKPAPSGAARPAASAARRRRRRRPPPPRPLSVGRTGGSPDAGRGPARVRRATPAGFALHLAHELAEEPVLEAALLGRAGQRQQPLLPAEGVGEVEQLEEPADRLGGRPAACSTRRSVEAAPLRLRGSMSSLRMPSRRSRSREPNRSDRVLASG